jgi:ubiquinone biosynthesis protein Coq4
MDQTDVALQDELATASQMSSAMLSLVDPASMNDTLDALMDGWRLGRNIEPLMAMKWTDVLDTDLDERRADMLKLAGGVALRSKG